MLHPDVRRHLDTSVIAHLATVAPDGAPHSVPVWIGTRGGGAPYPRGEDRVVAVVAPDRQRVGVG